MTDIEKKIEVMKAFAEGKEIQYNTAYSTKWQDTANPLWDWNTLVYRVKPEEPSYEAYTNCKDMVKDFKERFGVTYSDYEKPLIWVKHMHSKAEYLIDAYADTDVHLSNIWYSMGNLISEYTYLDGTPVGKAVK